MCCHRMGEKIHPCEVHYSTDLRDDDDDDLHDEDLHDDYYDDGRSYRGL